MPDHVIDFRFSPKRRWTCIGRPDDPYKSLVAEDGSLLYDHKSLAVEAYRFLRVLAFRLLTDEEPLAVSQETLTARFPAVRTTLRYRSATLELTAFGHEHDAGRRSDVLLWEITGHGPEEGVLTGLWLQAQQSGMRFATAGGAASHNIYLVRDGEEPVSHDNVNDFKYRSADEPGPPGAPVVLVAQPQRLRAYSAFDFGPASGLASEPMLLKPGERARGALILPLNHEQVDGLDLEWAEATLEAERAYWDTVPLTPAGWRVPDPAVQDMLDACARNILQAREVKDGLPEFQVGPTVYRGLWVADGHFFLEAAQYLGWAEDAMRGLDVLMRRSKEDSAFEQHAHHTKETAIALATLVRQCELSGDYERLAALWPRIMAGAAHIERMRQASSARGPEAPEYGLMSLSFADGGLGGMRAEYTTTLWTLAGLKHVLRAARVLGKADDEAVVARSYESLLAAFREHAARDTLTLPDGTPYLPMLKPGSGEHHYIVDYPGQPEPWRRVGPATGTWAFAHAIYPGEVFAPDDPIVTNFLRLLDSLDDQEGIPAETGWLPYKGLWSYYSSFAAHAWLYAGRGDKAADYLYAFANHATPTRVWREEQSLTSTGFGQGFGDMPHNWASVEFVRLARHLIVMERGDNLEFLAGLPAEWTRPGAELRLQATPTRFGPVSLDLRVAADGSANLTIETDPAWPLQPARRLLHASALGASGESLDLRPGRVALRLERAGTALQEA